MMAGHLLLEDTTIKSHYGYGLQVDRNASTTIRGGNFESWADDHAAIWLISNNMPDFDIKNATIISHGTGSQALNNQLNGSGKISNSTLITTGTESYALYTDYSVVEGDRLLLRTQGSANAGAVAARRGTIKLSNSEILASGNNSTGLFAFADSRIIADGVRVTMAGAEGWGASTTTGSLYFNNSEINATGADTAGIYSESFDGETPGVINLKNSKVAASQGIGILTSGGRLNVRLDNSRILSRCQNCQNAIYTASRLDESTGKLWNSLLQVDAKNNTAICGDIAAEQNSLLTVALKHNSLLSGAATNVDNLQIDNSSQWLISNHSTVRNLQLAGNAVFNASNDGFKNLTITNDLNGSGSFTFNSQLEGDDSQTDRLEVKGNASGNFSVVVKNRGGEGAETHNGIPLIHVSKDASGATFSQENAVTVGNYEYFLNKVNDHDWYLQASYVPTPDPSPPVPTIRKEIAGYQISPWLNADYAFNTAGTWHQRQGARRGSAHVWRRSRGLHNTLGASRFGYSTDTFFLQLGGDIWQKELCDGVTSTAGVMATFSKLSSNTRDYARLQRPGLSADAGKLNTQAWSLGGYYTIATPQGAWLDTVVQQTLYRTHFQSSSGTYQNSSSLLSLEMSIPVYLTQQWQLEPQLQLMSQWLHSGTSG